MLCPFCKNPLNDSASTCGHCGAMERKYTPPWAIIFVISASAIAGAVIYTFSNSNPVLGTWSAIFFGIIGLILVRKKFSPMRWFR